MTLESGIQGCGDVLAGVGDGGRCRMVSGSCDGAAGQRCPHQAGGPVQEEARGSARTWG